MSKLILTHMEYQGRPLLAAALEQEQRICQLEFLQEGSKEGGLLGNIYIGKVKNIVKNIQAAFIEIAGGIMCYYPLEEKACPLFADPNKKGPLRIGDELAVQVRRERMKTKQPSVSSNLNFAGRYLVLTTERAQLSFSGKLSKEEKKRLRDLLEGRQPLGCGLILRTNSREAAPEEIFSELEELISRYEAVKRKLRSRVCFSLLEESAPQAVRVLQDARIRGLEEIVTEDPVLYEQISRYLDKYQDKNVSLRLYEDRLLPLFKLYSLESVLEGALKERVWLKSGGFLVLQQTEAFVCVDVNTGKFSDRKEPRETFRKINLEAAKEIAFQLRLRNLSGIILIDFINMERAEDKKELLETLQKYLRQDPVKGTVVDMTLLDIVEVTRKKVRRPLAEEVKALL